MHETAIPVPVDLTPPGPAPNPVAAAPIVPPAAVPAHTEALFAELATLRAKQAATDAKEAAAAEAARLADIQKLADKGKIEELVKAHQVTVENERATRVALEARVRRAEPDRVLAEAFPANMVPETVPILRREWAEDFETVDAADGGFVVRDKTTHRDAKTVIAERLALPAYGFAVRAGRTDGGVPNRGGDLRPATPPASEGSDRPAVRNLGDAIALQFHQNHAALQTAGQNGFGFHPVARPGK